MPGQPIPAHLHSSQSHLPGRWQVLSQAIRGALNTPTTSVQHMGVDHRGAHIPVAQQFLDRPNNQSYLPAEVGGGTVSCLAGYGKLIWTSQAIAHLDV